MNHNKQGCAGPIKNYIVVQLENHKLHTTKELHHTQKLTLLIPTYGKTYTGFKIRQKECIKAGLVYFNGTFQKLLNLGLCWISQQAH